MQNYYLAVDIGASSGRHILGSLEHGKLVLEEVYRFPNGMKDMDGELCWDVEQLFAEILNGMKKCKEAGKIPVSMGIDTWAVDYVLLDKESHRIGNVVGYRDSRTNGMDKAVYERIPETSLYERTGIQKQIFNTIYQLMAVQKKHPEYLEQAESMLMIPDYFHYLLTGRKATEYTNATTTQLVNPDTKDWDYELIDMLGFPKRIFQQIEAPGTCLGHLTEEIREIVGYDCQVVLPATHDTSSAVMAVPAREEDVIYISSGTWSLMGIERMEADCSPKSMAHNFTNEGGYQYRFRYLKNIMGLWMIQSVRRELAPQMGFGEICRLASEAQIASRIDCNKDCFLAPENMTKEVQRECRENGLQVPQGIAEVAAVVYGSLADCYAKTVREIEDITGKKYDSIYVVGGGANAEYLNELTVQATGKRIYAGPTEATAIGNLLAQMIAAKEIEDLQKARNCVFESFGIDE